MLEPSAAQEWTNVKETIAWAREEAARLRADDHDDDGDFFLIFQLAVMAAVALSDAARLRRVPVDEFMAEWATNSAVALEPPE